LQNYFIFVLNQGKNDDLKKTPGKKDKIILFLCKNVWGAI